MSAFIAALPMYDWPECRAETDAEWARLRDALRERGIDAPENLTRRNADMPAVPGAIRDTSGMTIASDPATQPPGELDLPTLWRHPRLLFGQTCWGPMERGLAEHVRVVGQPDYSAYEGGQGPLYSSAVVMRAGHAGNVAAPEDGHGLVPLEMLRGKRFAYNGADSMSGIIGLVRDLKAMGENLDIFAERIETGGHRASVIAVAEDRADVCAIDCRTWDIARHFEPAIDRLSVVGWTARRKGLPYICGNRLGEEIIAPLRALMAEPNR